jgi:tRNA(Ile)-lysidine synthase
MRGARILDGVILDTLRRFFQAHRIGGPLLVAVSGGKDSTALLIALHEVVDFPLIAGHVNHHLRGAESDEDEAFVRALCKRLGVPLNVADGTINPELIRRSGIEGAAREVRMARLQEIRIATEATHIATAHQKNDQAETVLMRLMTGGSLRAIHQIREDGLIRPLLSVRRSEIDAFLCERGIVPRVDSSNADPRFLRNRVRAMLTQFDESAVDNLAALADRAREQAAVLDRLVDTVDDTVSTPSETRFRTIPQEPSLREALLHRHIRRLDADSRDVSAADLRRLARQLDSIKRVSVTKALELVRRGDVLVLRRRPLPTPQFEVELTPAAAVYIPEIKATIGLRPAARDARVANRFQLPHAAKPQFIIRNRREGDRFQPLGFPQEKKLKEFLIDRKIEAERRDRIPLLVWNGSIVWVAGVEVSEQFRVSDGPGDRYEVVVEEENQEDIQREGHRQADR